MWSSFRYWSVFVRVIRDLTLDYCSLQSWAGILTPVRNMWPPFAINDWDRHCDHVRSSWWWSSLRYWSIYVRVISDLDAWSSFTIVIRDRDLKSWPLIVISDRDLWFVIKMVIMSEIVFDNRDCDHDWETDQYTWGW